MSRREPTSDTQWRDFRFPRRPEPAVLPPRPAPAPVDWDAFRFPTCADPERLRRHGLLPPQDEAAQEGATGTGTSGDAEGGGGGSSGTPPPALRPPQPVPAQVPAPTSQDWEYDASGVRLVNCRLGRTMALARVDTTEKLDRLLAAAGASSSLASALDRASLDVHGVPIRALRASLPERAPLAWATPPRQRSRRRPR